MTSSDSLPAGAESQPVRQPVRLHLLGQFNQPYTGAERELLDMRRLLAGQADVVLWSGVPVHDFYAAEAITAILPGANAPGSRPDGGTLVIAGVHVDPPLWLAEARFDRVVLLYNLASHGRLFGVIEALRALTQREPELVFVSHMLQVSVGLPGRVIRSLMDVAPFLAVADARFSTPADTPPKRPFTIGRMSRDQNTKHHPDDPVLYRMLASRGIRVRIMGGTSLELALKDVAGVELLPVGAETTAAFCASLDAFFYRTGGFSEAYGRVVPEAMASGLPVVVHERGGYAELVAQGVSGHVIRTQEQAHDALMHLSTQPGLRRTLGMAARDQAIAVHGAEATQRDLAYFRNGA